MYDIVCLGSVNIDITGYVPAFPVPGETNAGSEIVFRVGGKGLNQMTACARLGDRVCALCRIGDDALSAIASRHFQKENMDTDHVRVTAGTATGAAIIEIEESTAENRISVFAGANALITPEDVRASAAAFDGAKVFLSQLETPVPALLEALRLAKAKGLVTVLNPAPARALPDEVYALTDVVTPNETEAMTLSGKKDIAEAAEFFRGKGVPCVIVTLGKRGSMLVRTDGTAERIPAFRVKAVDTVGAGDAYNGALVHGLAHGMEIREAMTFAAKYSALKVTRRGAAEGMPYLSEI